MQQTIDSQLVRSILKPREKSSHKGDYGHGALIAGSLGMMGAAVLSAKGFMRSGAGKLTAHIPAIGYTTMQVSIPEAMCKVEEGNDHIVSVSSLEKYDSVGIGPGIGQHDSHPALLSHIFKQYKKPVVIDADGLNTIAADKTLLALMPEGSILTPHAGEFARLFGEHENDVQRKETAVMKAALLKVIIVLKGAGTFIATPSGNTYINTTGNPGMATGGTGDVLTGIITGMLAQGYVPEEAAVAAVYLHGLAGDLAAAEISQQSLIASDIIDYLGLAFLQTRSMPGWFESLI